MITGKEYEEALKEVFGVNHTDDNLWQTLPDYLANSKFLEEACNRLIKRLRGE